MGATKSHRHVSQDPPALAAIAALSDPVVGTLGRTIHTWNAGAERLFGYCSDEIIGKPVSILYPPERLGELEQILLRLRRGETIEPFDTVRRRKDGVDIHVSLSISPVQSSSGEVVDTAIVHDISERKRHDEIQSFLAEASRLLAVDLDYRETLSRVAQLTVSSLADWCLVEISGAAAPFTHVAVAHRDPDKAERLRELRRLYPPDPDRPDISLRVLTTGRAELIPNVSDALLGNIAHDADHLRLLRELGPTSLIVVPLRAREQPLGTILLARAEPGRPFSLDDLDLAEDLGRRAALAIHNSALHRSEQEARRRAEQAVKRISGLQAVTAALSRAVTPAAVAEVFVREGAAAVGASGGFVRFPAPDSSSSSSKRRWATRSSSRAHTGACRWTARCREPKSSARAASATSSRPPPPRRHRRSSPGSGRRRATRRSRSSPCRSMAGRSA